MTKERRLLIECLISRFHISWLMHNMPFKKKKKGNSPGDTVRFVISRDKIYDRTFFFLKDSRERLQFPAEWNQVFAFAFPAEDSPAGRSCHERSDEGPSGC